MRAADRISRLKAMGLRQPRSRCLAVQPVLIRIFADAWAASHRLVFRWGYMSIRIQSGSRRLKPRLPRLWHFMDMVHADAFCARGQLLWTPKNAFQNRPALRALNAALKLNPGCHQAQTWRGLILFHLGLYAEARQGLEEALAVHPEDTRTMPGADCLCCSGD